MPQKPEWLTGIFPAIITPFTKDERVDEEALRALVQHLKGRVTGFVAAGTTGEFSSLTDEERARVIAIVIDEAGPEVPVIAGTGAISTRQTVALTQAAKDAGAKAALVCAPYYLKPSHKEVYEHFLAVDKIGMPWIMYNIPQCMGVHFKWWTAEGLAQLENIVGIKDSSGDMPFFMSTFEKFGEQIAIFCGHDEIAMPALAAGADGLILASANLVPEHWMKLYDAVRDSDLPTARSIQKDLQKLVRIVCRTSGPQAVKEGLEMMGVPVGHGRRPIMPGDAFQREDAEEIRSELLKLGYIEPKSIVFIKHDTSTFDAPYPAIANEMKTVGILQFRVGEGFAGPPHWELAHIDLVLGYRDGPVAEAINRALARESGMAENERKNRVIRQRPKILAVPTVTIRTKRQIRLFYTEAVNGVNLGIDKCIEAQELPEELLDDIVMIANVFVHPAAVNARRVYFNNYKAMRHALRRALEERPTVEEILHEKASARHPFKYTP